MITTLLAWAILTLGGHWAGSRILGAVDVSCDPVDRFVFRTWTGLLWMATALLVVSLLVPLKVAGSMLIVGCALVAVVSRPESGLSRREGIAGLLISLAVAFAMCGVVLLFDSGNYHRQNIAMLREFGTLSGAALLHYRWAFSSSWFALTAAFEPGFLRSRMGAIANGQLLVLATFHFASALWRITRGGATRGCWYLAAAYPVALYYILLETAAVSPSPNPAVALSLVLAGWVLHAAPANPRAAFALLGGTAALKLSAIPALAAGLIGRKAPLRLWSWLFAGVAPLLIANTITSGYPLFPGGPGVPSSHTLPEQQARGVQMETTNWGRYEFNAPPGQTRFLDLRWIPGWVRRVDKPLLLTLAASVLCLVWKGRFNPEVLLGLSGVAFVFVTAPDFRFLLGYVAILSGAAVESVAPEWPSRRLRFLNPAAWATLAVLCWILYAIARESLIVNRDRIDWRPRLIVPAGSPAVQPGRTVSLDGVRVLAPGASGQCWDLDFPCTPYPVAPNVHLCRPEHGLKGGICRGR